MAQNRLFLIAFGIIIPKKEGNGNPGCPLFSLFFGLCDGPKMIFRDVFCSGLSKYEEICLFL